MSFIYRANVYCNDCGNAIRNRLTEEGKAPTDKQGCDSDDFPKSAKSCVETDTPQHCAANEDCINTIEIGERGDEVVGLLFGGLTSEGVIYVEKAIGNANRGNGTRSQEGVVGLWYRYYTIQGYRFRNTPNWDY